MASRGIDIDFPRNFHFVALTGKKSETRRIAAEHCAIQMRFFPLILEVEINVAGGRARHRMNFAAHRDAGKFRCEEIRNTREEFRHPERPLDGPGLREFIKVSKCLFRTHESGPAHG